jgi:uncharacterized protein involved in exopolysaccharide biosynthesis
MEDDINLKEVFLVFARWWKLIFLISASFAIIAYVIASFAKPVYEAKVRILMRSSGGSSLGGLSGLANMAGLNLGPGGIGEFQGLIESRKVQDYVSDELINTRNVADFVSKEATHFFADGKPTDMGKMEANIEGSFFVIRVKHKNPRAAQLICNSYVKALAQYWNKLNSSEARKKLNYIEQEMPVKERQLKAAEDKLKGLMYLNDAQGEVETVEIARAKREVSILTSVYMMLRTDYETAKLDVAKEISPFSDVEPALLPSTPLSSKKSANTVMGGVIGFFMGVFLAFAADPFLNKKKK